MVLSILNLELELDTAYSKFLENSSGKLCLGCMSSWGTRKFFLAKILISNGRLQLYWIQQIISLVFTSRVLRDG